MSTNMFMVRLALQPSLIFSLLAMASAAPRQPLPVGVSIRPIQQSGNLVLQTGNYNPWGTGTIGKQEPQDFRFLFDTGAGDIIIPQNPSDAIGYNFTGTYQNKIMTEGFSSGVDKGPVYADDLTFAGITANDVEFIVVERSVSDQGPGGSNADVGMDYTTKSMTGTAGFFETLIMQQKVATPEFSFWFARDHLNTPSELLLGGRDPSRFMGDVIVANVTSQNYWTIQIDGAFVNGQIVSGLSAAKGIVDTGDPGISCSVSCAKAIHAMIPGTILLPGSDDKSSQYAYPCNTPTNYIPAIIIGVHGLAIDPLDFNAGPVDSNTLSQTSHLPKGVAYCKSVLGGNGDGWLIGLPFMHNWYTIFHWGAETKGSEVGAGTAVIFAKAVQKQVCSMTPAQGGSEVLQWSYNGCWNLGWVGKG